MAFLRAQPSMRTALKTSFVCCFLIFATQTSLFAKPLLSEGCCIFIYLEVIAHQQVCMRQCGAFSNTLNFVCPQSKISNSALGQNNRRINILFRGQNMGFG
jgi:hypothetical protein